MPKYVRPGVFVEESPIASREITGVPTSVTAFVGPTPAGPVGEARPVASLADYEAVFGSGARGTAEDVTGRALELYLENGGDRALVLRVPGDPGVAGSAEYGRLLAELWRTAPEVDLLVLPGQSWGADGRGNAVIAGAIAHAETTRACMVLVDPPPGVELRTGAEVAQLALPTSSHAVLDYPWVLVPAVGARAPKTSSAGKPRPVAPSGAVAGTWTRIDRKRGVWKAPAGIEAGLKGLSGLEFAVDDAAQGVLNPLGVNALRTLVPHGPVIWGARTLATQADPEWRYVPVRRTAIYLEQSLSRGLAWTVFEPNDAPLWAAVLGACGNFLNGLFRAGAFQGARERDAWFVRCGVGQTMTAADQAAGRLIVQLGFAPMKPAEFVLLRLELEAKPHP